MGKVCKKITSLDLLGEGFNMNVDNEVSQLQTGIGTLFTIMVLSFLLIYAEFCTRKLFSKTQQDIMQTVK